MLCRTPVGYFLGLSQDGAVVRFPDAGAGLRHWEAARRAQDAEGRGRRGYSAAASFTACVAPHWSILELGDLELEVAALLSGFPATVARLGSVRGYLGALLDPDKGGPAWRSGRRAAPPATAAAQDALCARWTDGCSVHRNMWETPPPAANEPRPPAAV